MNMRDENPHQEDKQSSSSSLPENSAEINNVFLRSIQTAISKSSLSHQLSEAMVDFIQRTLDRDYIGSANEEALFADILQIRKALPIITYSMQMMDYKLDCTLDSRIPLIIEEAKQILKNYEEIKDARAKIASYQLEAKHIEATSDKSVVAATLFADENRLMSNLILANKATKLADLKVKIACEEKNIDIIYGSKKCLPDDFFKSNALPIALIRSNQWFPSSKKYYAALGVFETAKDIEEECESKASHILQKVELQKIHLDIEEMVKKDERVRKIKQEMTGFLGEVKKAKQDIIEALANVAAMDVSLTPSSKKSKKISADEKKCRFQLAQAELKIRQCAEKMASARFGCLTTAMKKTRLEIAQEYKNIASFQQAELIGKLTVDYEREAVKAELVSTNIFKIAVAEAEVAQKNFNAAQEKVNPYNSYNGSTKKKKKKKKNDISPSLIVETVSSTLQEQSPSTPTSGIKEERQSSSTAADSKEAKQVPARSSIAEEVITVEQPSSVSANKEVVEAEQSPSVPVADFSKEAEQASSRSIAEEVAHTQQSSPILIAEETEEVEQLSSSPRAESTQEKQVSLRSSAEVIEAEASFSAPVATPVVYLKVSDSKEEQSPPISIAEVKNATQSPSLPIAKLQSEVKNEIAEQSVSTPELKVESADQSSFSSPKSKKKKQPTEPEDKKAVASVTPEASYTEWSRVLLVHFLEIKRIMAKPGISHFLSEKDSAAYLELYFHVTRFFVAFHSYINNNDIARRGTGLKRISPNIVLIIRDAMAHHALNAEPGPVVESAHILVRDMPRHLHAMTDPFSKAPLFSKEDLSGVPYKEVTEAIPAKREKPAEQPIFANIPLYGIYQNNPTLTPMMYWAIASHTLKQLGLMQSITNAAALETLISRCGEAAISQTWCEEQKQVALEQDEPRGYDYFEFLKRCKDFRNRCAHAAEEETSDLPSIVALGKNIVNTAWLRKASQKPKSAEGKAKAPKMPAVSAKKESPRAPAKKIVASNKHAFFPAAAPAAPLSKRGKAAAVARTELRPA